MSRQFEEFKRIICEFNFDNTYKVAWAKALIELSSELPIAEEQTRITISLIAQKYMQYYWDLLIRNDLPQSSNSQKPPEVVTTIKNLINVYYDCIDDQTPDYFRNAVTIIPKGQLEAALKKVTSILKKDVSYRFLMLNRQKTDVYAYSKGDDRLWISSSLLQEIRDDKLHLLDLVHYRWGKIIELFAGELETKKDTFIIDEHSIDKNALLEYERMLGLETARAAKKKIKSVTAYVAINDRSKHNYSFKKEIGRGDSEEKTYFYCTHLRVDDFRKNQNGYFYTQKLESEEHKGCFTIILYSDDISTLFSQSADEYKVSGTPDNFSVCIQVEDTAIPIEQYQRGDYSTCAVLVEYKDLIKNQKAKEEKRLRKRKRYPETKQADSFGNDENCVDSGVQSQPAQNASFGAESPGSELRPHPKEVVTASIKKDTDILIRTKHSNGCTYEYIIVSDADSADRNARRIHYTQPLARELLTALFHDSRQKQGCYNGKCFEVTGSAFGGEKADKMRNEILAKKLILRQGGGNISSLTSGYYELVDLLLYSPFTKRYELLRATYDKRTDDYYTAPWRFRNFVESYGNPGLNLNFYSEGRVFADFSEYNAESILMVYGYSAAEGVMSEEQRQEILAEIVDLGILSPGRVARFMNFFIRTHPGIRYTSARQKWENDLRFIDNYRVDRNRFLIAK